MENENFMAQCDMLKCLNCRVTFELKKSENDLVILSSQFSNQEFISFPPKDFLKDLCGVYKIVAFLSKTNFPNSEIQTVLEIKST